MDSVLTSDVYLRTEELIINQLKLYTILVLLSVRKLFHSDHFRAGMNNMLNWAVFWFLDFVLTSDVY